MSLTKFDEYLNLLKKKSYKIKIFDYNKNNINLVKTYDGNLFGGSIKEHIEVFEKKSKDIIKNDNVLCYTC
ncbi:MAG: hypothetical protein ACK5HL_02685, partial [Bacilli bacterium]